MLPRLSLIKHCRYISRCLMVIGLLFCGSTTHAFTGFPFFPFPWPYVPPPPPPPPPPTTKPVAPASITAPASVTSAVPGSWTVSWSASTGASYYELWESLNDATWAKVYSGSATSRYIPKTLSGTFKYRAKACNVLGCSPYTATSSVAAVIGRPSTLTLPTGTDTDGNFHIGWPQNTLQRHTANWPPPGWSRSTATKHLQSKEAGYWANSYLLPYNSTGKTMTNKATGNYSFRLRTKGQICFYPPIFYPNNIPYGFRPQCYSVDYFELPKQLTVIRKPAIPPTPTIANKTDEQDTEYIVNWQTRDEATRYEVVSAQSRYRFVCLR